MSYSLKLSVFSLAAEDPMVLLQSHALERTFSFVVHIVSVFIQDAYEQPIYWPNSLLSLKPLLARNPPLGFSGSIM